MTSGRPQRTRKGLARAVLSLSVTTIVGTVVATSAFAVDGQQSPAPVLSPAPVAAAASNFELSNGSCDGSGGAGWRVQTFIVDSGVDLATLLFDQGVGFDQVGTDRDGSDGTIRSPLWKDNAPGTGFQPAASPAGLINPSDLEGFDFSNAGWVLTDGAYQLGYACLDDQSELRQWWTVPVTIDADASSGSFLAVGVDAGTTTTTTAGGSTTSTTAAGATTTTTTGGATTSTTTTGGSTTTTIASGEVSTTTGGSGGTTSTTRASGVLSAQSTQGTGSSSLPATGQGLAIAGVGLLLIYLGRVGNLLGRPDRR